MDPDMEFCNRTSCIKVDGTSVALVYQKVDRSVLDNLINLIYSPTHGHSFGESGGKWIPFVKVRNRLRGMRGRVEFESSSEEDNSEVSGIEPKSSLNTVSEKIKY
eukprot:UN32716